MAYKIKIKSQNNWLTNRNASARPSNFAVNGLTNQNTNFSYYGDN